MSLRCKEGCELKQMDLDFWTCAMCNMSTSETPYWCGDKSHDYTVCNECFQKNNESKPNYVGPKCKHGCELRYLTAPNNAKAWGCDSCQKVYSGGETPWWCGDVGHNYTLCENCFSEFK